MIIRMEKMSFKLGHYRKGIRKIKKPRPSTRLKRGSC